MASIWNIIKKDVERYNAPDDINLAQSDPS